MKADLQKHTLNFRPGDWAYLESIYKSHGLPTSVVIRTLISAKVDELKAQEEPVELNMEGVEI